MPDAEWVIIINIKKEYYHEFKSPQIKLHIINNIYIKNYF